MPKKYYLNSKIEPGESFTVREIGKIMGISKSRVQQIERLALEKVGAALKEKGIEFENVFKRENTYRVVDFLVDN